MSQTTRDSASTAEETDFGPNQWLVDELRSQFNRDPDSVDPSWARFFRDHPDAGRSARPASSNADPSGDADASGDADSSDDTDARGGRAASGSGDSGSARDSGPAGDAGAASDAGDSAPAGADRDRAQHAAQAKEQEDEVKSSRTDTDQQRSTERPAPASPERTSGAKRASRTTSEQEPGQQPATDGADQPKAETKAETKAAPKAEQAPAAAEGKPARTAPSASDRPAKAPKPAPEPETYEAVPDEEIKLRGPAAAVVKNMAASLEVPTATSVRDVPVKLLFDNRIVINNHLKRRRGGKVSFTHLIGFAMVEALTEVPDLNNGYTEQDGKPFLVRRHEVNFGLAIDMPRPDGSRSLLVPSIKSAQRLDFAGFVAAYEDLVKKARANKLAMTDFQGTTVTLTNPGGIGTVHSIPRLMSGQGVIMGVGAMNYPAQFQGASPETLAELAVSKVMTLTSTYDHRVIQGAASGEFLRAIADKLLGLDGFYDRVFRALRIPYEPVRWVADNPLRSTESERLAHVMDLIHAFRVRGHLMADIDPLEYRVRHHPDLDVQTHGLTLWDLDRVFPTRGLGGTDRATLRDILGVLRDAYCRTIGIEYMHLAEPAEREFFRERMEAPVQEPSDAERRHILNRLNAAEAFETFLQTKFVGQKRFSLEGGESVIPMLDAMLTEAARDGVEEVGIGMAHRGRLNVLANIAGKKYGQIFQEFEGNQDPRTVLGSGDVKYHLGTEGSFTGPEGESTKVYLAANPSHLEAVNPVLEGIVRAKQDKVGRGGKDFPVLPVLLHGDAAMSGQGVVAETLALAELRGYRTGGTIHIVINNQIGFTTTPESSRSSYYSTDIAKSTQLPIFHVNGEDPEAVVRVAKLAYEFRQTFHRDVVIDMLCYRKRGHNEGDDPSMTQPEMYRIIESKRSARKLYTESLIARGALTEEDAEEVVKDFQEQLEAVFASSREEAKRRGGGGDIQGLERPAAQQESRDDDASTDVDTAVEAEVLTTIGDAHVDVPETFSVHPKIKQLAAKRREMSSEGGIDWGYGEILAFGSLLMEGVPVRLAGQDSRRGTFVQRHSVLVDYQDGDTWTPLLHLSDGQARFNAYDSPLSEFAALGFEYGYSVEAPKSLVLWEAQFGDFVNGAQTIIDEFISASEQKWGQRSSLVLLLPHGYEGQGPDHSSARPERFLQLCAEDNMRVAMPSTPASYFHLLRRQAKTDPKKPLVVFTPKSMLRHKRAVSAVEDFTTGSFRPLLEDPTADPSRVTKVLLCAGKVYWDLLAAREKNDADDVAILRLEQLYPLEDEVIADTLGRYGDAELRWVQEEPRNQGAWSFISMTLAPRLGRTLSVASRPASASPAAGSSSRHKEEQERLVADAFSF